jgi:hypothetical protein
MKRILQNILLISAGAGIVFAASAFLGNDAVSQSAQQITTTTRTVPKVNGECPPCTTDNGSGACTTSNTTLSTDNSTSIFAGSKFTEAIDKLGKFFSGGRQDIVGVNVPNCGSQSAPPVREREVFPEGKLPTDKFLPSGRKIIPSTQYNDVGIKSGDSKIGSNYQLMAQYDPNEIQKDHNYGGFINEARFNPKNQWRGGCGRGIFLYETLDMKNSNAIQPKATSGAACETSNFTKFDDFIAAADCKTDVEDVKAGILQFNLYGQPSEGGHPRKVMEPRIWSNDLWYSRTGCYNPEERFSYIPTYPTPGYFFGQDDGLVENIATKTDASMFQYFEPIFSTLRGSLLGQAVNTSGLGPKEPGPLDEPLHYRNAFGTADAWAPKKGTIYLNKDGKKVNSPDADGTTLDLDNKSDFLIPNDRLLMRHPFCAMVSRNALNAVYDNEVKAVDKDPYSTSKLIKEGKLPVCMEAGTFSKPGLGDIIDETDNFCREFLSKPGQNNVERYYLSGNCWEKKSIIIAPDPLDHWMPQAIKTKFRSNDEIKSLYTHRDQNISYFWRVTRDAKFGGNTSTSYTKEAVAYKSIRVVNNFNKPTFTPSSLKNAYRSSTYPGNDPNIGISLPTTLGEMEQDACLSDVSVFKDSSGNPIMDTDGSVKVKAGCKILTNFHNQGEYGYLDRNIERGPFIFRKLADGKLVNNPPGSTSGTTSFNFDQAIKYLRGGGNQEIEKDFNLNYLPGRLIPIDYAFNPYNIYAPQGPEYGDDQVHKIIPKDSSNVGIGKPEYYGRKWKQQQCLRIFIEKWAFEGDKGNIVTDRGRFAIRNTTNAFVPDISYCQWTAYYGADNGGGDKNYQKEPVGAYSVVKTAFSAVLTSIKTAAVWGDSKLMPLADEYSDTQDINPATQRKIPNTGAPVIRPLNSEFYDYLNFLTMGSVELADESGCQTLNCYVANQSGNLFKNPEIIEAFKKVNISGVEDLPEQIQKWQAGEVDLTKRDCNSIVPPSYWRDAIKPFSHCQPVPHGWWRIKKPLKNLFCFSAACSTSDEVTTATTANTDGTLDNSMQSLSGESGSSGVFGGIGGKIKSWFEDNIGSASLLTTEVDTPFFSLFTPVIQGMPTIGLGLKFPTDVGAPPPKGNSSAADFAGGGSAGNGKTIDLTYGYIKVGTPGIKLILRDNWLSRMGGQRLVPMSLLDSISGAVVDSGNDDTSKGINLGGLPIIKLDKDNLSATDWIDSSLTARSCSHTALSGLTGFSDTVDAFSKEAWNTYDDLSLLGTTEALTEIKDFFTGGFTMPTSPADISPAITRLIQKTRIYGGIRISDGGAAIRPDLDKPEQVLYGLDSDALNNTIGDDFKRTRYRIFYSWFPSPWVFEHGEARNHWCQFQVPYNPYLQGKKEWQFAKTPYFGHANLNPTLNGVAVIHQNSPFTVGKFSNDRPRLNYYRPERIRDGCGAFAVRATWIKDENVDLSDFLIGRHPNGAPIHESRCAKWVGLFGAEYDDPKIISWRLPRFDYEFLKAFLDCTGPIRKNPPANCYENKRVVDRNIDEVETQAAWLVTWITTCATGTCADPIPKKIANATLRMADFLTRGDTWYAGAEGNTFTSDAGNNDSAMDDQSGQLRSDLQSAFENTNADSGIEDLINDVMSGVDLEDALLRGNGRISANDILSQIDKTALCEKYIPNPLKETFYDDDNKSTTPVVRRDPPKDLSSSERNSVKNECEQAIESFANSSANSFNANIGTKFDPHNSNQDDNVGDLACGEDAKQSPDKGCYHTGKYGIYGEDYDEDRKVECQRCSMQIKDFWRVKKSNYKSEKEKGGAWGGGGFWGTGLFRKTFRQLEVDSRYGTSEPFGFWCNCPNDDTATTRCREDMCTCDQHVLMVGRGVGKSNTNSVGRKLTKNIEKANEERCILMGMGNPMTSTSTTIPPCFSKDYDKKKGEAAPSDRDAKVTALEKKIEKIVEMKKAIDDPASFSGRSSFFSPMAFCKDYGPMRRWLQCYYQARSKACPVLTREVSDTEPPEGLKNNMRLTDGLNLYGLKSSGSTKLNDKPSGGRESKRAGVEPRTSGAIKDASYATCSNNNTVGFVNMFADKFARWSAEEPNHLARLNVQYESAGASFKHQDFVFQSQVRDIEAPFMEMSVPFHIELASRGLTPTTTYATEIENANPGKNPNDISLSADEKNKYFVKRSEDGDEIEEIEQRYNTTIDVDQLILPKLKDGKLNPKYWDMAVKFEVALNAASVSFNDYQVSARRPALYDNTGDHKQVNLRAQEAVVGPRGCDIGGWYEMMLYQARCIKFFGLNCICDYDKTFARGDAKAYVLGRAGMQLDAAYPVLENVAIEYKTAADINPEDKNKIGFGTDEKDRNAKAAAIAQSTNVRHFATRTENFPLYLPDNKKANYDQAKASARSWRVETVTKSFPLMDRGLVGPEFALGIKNVTDHKKDANPREKFRKWKRTGYKGLDEVVAGDIIIYDEEITYEDANYKADAGYPRHVAYVERVNREPKCNYYDPIIHTACLNPNPNAGRPISIEVSEMNWGKNPDSCGNTDTWGIRTYRTIMRPKDLADKLDVRKQYYASCQNADWAMCEEKYWDKIKIYRPYTVKDVSGLPVYKSDDDDNGGYNLCPSLNSKILNFDEMKAKLNISANVQVDDFATATSADNLTPKEVFDDYDNDGNLWLRKLNTFDAYDLRKVNKYLKDNINVIGVCDPAPAMRANKNDVWNDYKSAKDYLDRIGY